MKKTLVDSSLIILFALLSLSTLQAAGPIFWCAPGQPLIWPNGGANIPFNPDQGGLGPLSNAAAVAQTMASFDVWESVPSSTATFVDAGLLSIDVDDTNFGPFLNPTMPDGLSAIVYDEDGAIFDLLFGSGTGILGFAGPEWFDPATCEVLEGMAFLNGGALSGGATLADLQAVQVHEFGHYSGLAHSVVNGQIVVGDTSGPTPDFATFPPESLAGRIETMYPFYFGPAAGTETPAPDDIASLSTLYPAPGFFDSTGSISGTIRATNGTTPLTGANVIARNLAAPYDDAVSALSGDYGFPGEYTLNGLTPGADYALFVDQILAGGFSTPPLVPLPGPEEFFNGAQESTDGSLDNPSDFTPLTAVAGNPVTGVDVLFNRPRPGAPLLVGDDGSVEIFLPFEAAICGVSYSSVFVNANGNLTIGTPSSDFSESVAEFLTGPPRIAGVWDDLTPFLNGTPQGKVFYTLGKESLTVHYENVPEFPSAGANSFSITLEKKKVFVDYAGLTLSDGVAGITCGGRYASGFEPPLDLSEAKMKIMLKEEAAAYESFGGGINDLAWISLEYDPDKGFTDKWEANDGFDQAAKTSLPFDTFDAKKAYSEISPLGDDVDWFELKDLESGTTLVADIRGGILDTVMGLFRVEGTGKLATLIPVALDDDGGAGRLSRILAAVPQNGDYLLAVSTFPDFDFSGNGVDYGRYTLEVSAINGKVLSLGDDSSAEVPLNFSFPFQGSSYNSVFVNANGNLTFGEGSGDYSETVGEFLSGLPRIAPLWDDLSPNNGGLVSVDGDFSRLTVSFRNVPEFPFTGANNFSATLYPNGEIQIDYGSVTALDGLAGITPGGGVADPGASDLSAASFSATGTTYELFGLANVFDLMMSSLQFLVP